MITDKYVLSNAAQCLTTKFLEHLVLTIQLYCYKACCVVQRMCQDVEPGLHRQMWQPMPDPGPARRARAPRFEKFWGVVFVNFDCITRIYFDVSQHAMFKICILFNTLLQKLRVYV